MDGAPEYYSIDTRLSQLEGPQLTCWFVPRNLANPYLKHP